MRAKRMRAKRRTNQISVLFFTLCMMMFILPQGRMTVFADGSSGGVLIDENNFPDEIFRAYVSKTYDANKDGTLSSGEIKNATHMDVTNLYSEDKISNLKGIELFPYLTRIFCSGNKLSSLDVSQNTALKHLNCSYNNLTSLDVSQNVVLEFLYCSNNNLTSLDVSKNTALRHFDCSYNNLTSFDASQNVSLEGFSCSNNNLTSLDLSHNTALTDFSCSDNYFSISPSADKTGSSGIAVGENHPHAQ